VVTDHRERAQLLLIGSVVVAVAILGTVVLLNIIHVPPDVSAQTDSQSITDAERVQDSVEDDLQQLVLMHTSVNETGEPLPYVNPDTFNESVEVYGQNYTELSTTSSAAVTSVDYVNKSSIGSVVYQNTTDSLANGTVLRSVESVPRLYVNVSEIANSEYANISIRNININVSSSAVIVDGSTVCGNSLNPPIEIDILGGSGTVRENGNTCAELDIDPAGTDDIGINPSGDSASGTYVISAIGAVPASGAENSVENVDVNPTFHVVYQDANVAYETTFSAFGGDS
jgi:hypothetical protein